MARKAFLISAAVVLASVAAHAQPADPIGELLAPAASTPPPAADHQTVRRPLSESDLTTFRTALEAARRGDVTGARNAIALLNDPVARKTANWALVDAAGESLGFFEVDRARRELTDWPRASRRTAVAEKLVLTSGKTPRQILDWFGDRDPATAQGAMAKADAYRALGEIDNAKKLIRTWWRDKSFEADVQRTMLTRFGDLLTAEDHIRRADTLLYGAQGPAARDVITLLPADQQQAAFARIALRSGAANANDLVAALPASVSNSPGVAFERAAYLRKKGLTTMAAGLAVNFPKDVTSSDGAEKVWDERYQLVLASLRAGDARAAYAAADAGLTSGSDAADSEFYAGWIALSKLKDPERAARHFQALERIGQSPITKARAYYWLGRTAAARGDQATAEAHYKSAAKHHTTFYGQLAGEKLGQRLVLGSDPVLTQADRTRFEGRDTVQAARLLYDVGQKNLFNVFVLALDDIVPTAADQALLVDMARGYGNQDLSMKVARAAAQRGFILPQRAYPLRTPPQVANGPEPALVLGITRQESGFDPLVRSGVGARGMMQLMPATAQIVARKIGVDYSPSMLDQPEYNMRLGSSFLGQLVSQFSGSYVMAIAGYNAGPGRPVQWSSFCGDPRGGNSDPIDFIECIPFSETRNYVMRVMEGMQVYRAKLNGGSAPITLSSDLQRGAYGYPPPASTVAAASETAS
ncbi:transglycosylase SLT domain-containing protein [Phenylobacterium deserti]|uniref:Lytic transglycosylase domain-containing protein n=1 Tax=Phenylobacterium deserti TaxID=1914756 RepID=A0A328A8Y6_9CAUL|nr:transglycosylase SLT domain-containing protein [Phenylobacterium deserti]RAK50965.1 lytic transglycosylase domain-containing protein [Phenylobacterium deserti]